MSLRTDVGSLFIIGVEATALNAMEAAWLKLLQPAGIILFRRNIEETAQVQALLTSAAALVDRPMFRCIDVEGGLVDRLRDLTAPMPSAAAVASAGNKNLSIEHGRLIGEELALLGLNTTFAPVLDLGLPISAHVMKTRVAAHNAEDVLEYAANFLRGLRKVGVLGCGKHFPGLGGGTLDSHASTPEIARNWEQLWKEDLLPYRKLHRKLPFIMVAHGEYPRVKPAQGPASVSKYWITEVLKKKIGYRGLILSDDMEMGGVLNKYSIENATVAAIAAGTHLVEVCKEPALILRAYEAALREAERSAAFRRKVTQAAAHVRAHQKKLLKREHIPTAVPMERVEAMRKSIDDFATRVQKQLDLQQASRRRATK